MANKIGLVYSHNGPEIKLSKYLSVADVADRLGVSPSTIREYTKRGLLLDQRNPLNGYRLYLQKDIDRLVKRINKSKKRI